MKRIVFALCVGAAGCNGAPATPPAAPEPAPSPVAPAPAPLHTAGAEVEPAPSAPSRAEREQRAIQLLEGRVPEPDLPTDSGG
jgi:hypothetical protein